MSRIFWKVSALAWGILLSYLLLIPFPDIDTSSFDIPFKDKIVHILLFLIWTYLLLQFFGNKKKLSVLLFVLFYGIGTEVAQSFIPDRSCELMDVMADALGIAVGYYLYQWNGRLLKS